MSPLIYLQPIILVFDTIISFILSIQFHFLVQSFTYFVIRHDDGGQYLLDKAGVEKDNGIINAVDTTHFLTTAKTRQWMRESKVRTLA